jgi:hypothetical protein
MYHIFIFNIDNIIILYKNLFIFNIFKKFLNAGQN